MKKYTGRRKLIEELLDALMSGEESKEEIFGSKGLLRELTSSIANRMLKGELNHHLGYKDGESIPEGQSNRRNGYTSKTMTGKNGQLEVEMPRDRQGDFEPKVIKKHQRRFDGFDDKIVSMYSLGMSTRDIQKHLEEIYATQVSADLISEVTSEVIDEVRQWQNRQLDSVYPIVYFDALNVKIRDGAQVKNHAVNLALGVNIEGFKEVLGMWISQSEGSKFWLSIINNLKNRGVEEIYIACVDGLKGFPEAIEAVYPQTQVQLCIVHLVRHSLRYVPWKDRKEVADDLKRIYRAASVQEAEAALEEFSKKWDKKYPMIAESWRNNWSQVTPFLDYPADIRKAIYTTNAIESLNDSLKKTLKPKRMFPNIESAEKLIYLGLKRASKRWSMPIRNWKGALNQFAIMFKDRFPTHF